MKPKTPTSAASKARAQREAYERANKVKDRKLCGTCSAEVGSVAWKQCVRCP